VSWRKSLFRGCGNEKLRNATQEQGAKVGNTSTLKRDGLAKLKKGCVSVYPIEHHAYMH
jgi:hypothetical protein